MKKIILALIAFFLVYESNAQTAQSSEIRLPNYQFGGSGSEHQHPLTATVSIPNGAIVTAVRGMMRNGQGNELYCQGNFGPVAGGCSINGECACGWAGMDNPVYSGNTVSCVFYNWSDCDVRYATLYVDYKIDPKNNASNSSGGQTKKPSSANCNGGTIHFYNGSDHSVQYYYYSSNHGASINWCQGFISGGILGAHSTINATVSSNKDLSYVFTQGTNGCTTQLGMRAQGVVSCSQANGQTITVYGQ